MTSDFLIAIETLILEYLQEEKIPLVESWRLPNRLKFEFTSEDNAILIHSQIRVYLDRIQVPTRVKNTGRFVFVYEMGGACQR